ncbi:MAG: transglycosylase domain-containing protein [Bacteroidales bacterium]|nr:transglycosylase domain-containing protein [Bacteroidales bacterium]HNW74213.1 transglycosylase domain-containing protein [Bacteroidales bacterium]HPS50638.1 transglycosylase domain-containing protein [Bacteroidales bacterium]
MNDPQYHIPMLNNRPKPPSRDELIKKYIKGFWITFVVLVIFTILFFIGVANGLLGPMPTFEELENPKSSLASEVISSDNKLLGKYYIENRSNTHFQELSPNVINALIATEDARFDKHSGIDAIAIFRVMWGMATGSSKGGGSTITQQLAKNLFPRKQNRTFWETVMIKFKEWITAVKLERNYSKDEILAMYLNTVDFGSQSYGIKSAAKTYFNKDPESLSIEESAVLIGILKAPTWFSPVRNPARAFERRNTVMHQMMKYDYITEQEYDSLRLVPIDMSNFRLQDHTAGIATYFREYLRMVLSEWCSQHTKDDGNPYNLYRDGLKIYTTINYKMQEYAEQAVHEYLGKELQPSFFAHWKGVPNAPFVFESDVARQETDNLMLSAMRRTDRYYRLKTEGYSDAQILQDFKTPARMKVFSYQGEIDTVMTPMDSIRYYKFFLQAGLMSMDPHNGQVRAYVGGIDYRFFQYDHVKLSKRQVGSTFKPFLYTLAMQEGESPCARYPNVQPVIDLGNGQVWAPENASDERLGQQVTLKWALANSNNWVSGQLIRKYSPKAVVSMAHKMGVTSDIPAVYSIALGSCDLSLYEMVGAMSVFANKGVYIEPVFLTRIEDKNGNVLETFTPKSQESISEETAWLMIQLMKGVVESGTSIRLRYKYGFDNPIAGKTGTTQNQSDGWFMGIAPDLVTGVWVGCEDRAAHFRSITLGQGANMALPVWALYMQRIYGDLSLRITKRDFDAPSKPVEVDLDCSEDGPPAPGKNKKKKQVIDTDEF